MFVFVFKQKTAYEMRIGDWSSDVGSSDLSGIVNEKVQPVGSMMIFDKSFLQGLTVDEAVILDQMFSCVVTPLFFVETMADLTKETARGRTAEQIGRASCRESVCE